MGWFILLLGFLVALIGAHIIKTNLYTEGLIFGGAVCGLGLLLVIESVLY